MIVCGEVFKLVKVLETTPYVLSELRDGATAAYVMIGPTRPIAQATAIIIETLLNFFI